MKKNSLIFFLVTFSLLGINFLVPVGADTTLTISNNPTEPWLTAGNGEKINITAGNRTQLKTMKGNQIRIQTNESVKLQINESETNPTGPLPNQTRAVNQYMHLELNGTVEMNATLFRNYTNSELSGLGNVSTFKWAFYNTSTFQWQYTHHNWVEMTPEGATVLCNTTHFSIWTILAPESSNPNGSWITAGNGEKINITAGNRSQIKTMNGNQIRIQTNESVKLQINESETNPTGPLPNQTRAVNRYMHLELNGTVAMNATLFRNYTNTEIAGLGNVSTFKWAFYNTTKFQWQYADQNWIEITPEGATVLCNTTHFSIWTILSPESTETPQQNPTPGTPFNSQNGTGFAIEAGHQYQIQTQSGFSLQLKLNLSSEISVTEYEKSPKAMTQQKHHIRTQTIAIEMNNTAQIQANFSFALTNQLKNQLGVKNMEKLKFMFYNESSEAWEAPKHQWLEGDTLYCNTTHFSLWTIAEEELEETTASSTSASSTPGFTLIPLVFTIISVMLLNYKKRE